MLTFIFIRIKTIIFVNKQSGVVLLLVFCVCVGVFWAVLPGKYSQLILYYKIKSIDYTILDFARFSLLTFDLIRTKFLQQSIVNLAFFFVTKY